MRTDRAPARDVAFRSWARSAARGSRRSPVQSIARKGVRSVARRGRREVSAASGGEISRRKSEAPYEVPALSLIMGRRKPHYGKRRRMKTMHYGEKTYGVPELWEECE